MGASLKQFRLQGTFPTIKSTTCSNLQVGYRTSVIAAIYLHLDGTKLDLWETWLEKIDGHMSSENLAMDSDCRKTFGF